MLHEVKKKGALNENAAPFACEAHNNVTSTAEKKKSSELSDNGNKVENKNEWKKMSTKRCASNKKREKVEEKWRDLLNRFSRLQERSM